MRENNALYNDIPPSKMAKKERAFIYKENRSQFWLKVSDIVTLSMIEKFFNSFRVKTPENIEKRDKSKSTIFYAPHNCWWDGIIGYYLNRRLFNMDLRMMIEQLHQFPLLSRIGAFSVSKRSAKSPLKAIDFSAKLLQNPSRALWLFPQGIVRPPDYRPIKFASGISYLCQRLDGVNLVPVAFRYTFLREDKPDVLIEVGNPITFEKSLKDIDRKELNSFLEKEFTVFLDNQRDEISKGQLDDYQLIFQARPRLFKRIERFFKKF